MQVVDSNGNVFGSGLEVTGSDGKPKGGSSGAQGPAGPQGIQGITGIQGLVGIQGPIGIQGITGTGIQGTDGPQGVQGVQGTSGGGSGDGLLGSQIQFNNNGNQSSFGFNATITAGNTGSLVPTANRLDVYPITPNKTLTNVSFTINLTTGIANALARLVVYSNSNSFPTTKLYESTDIDCSTLGDKTVLTGLTFTAGTTYWIGSYTVGGATFRALAPNTLLPIFWTGLTTPAVAWSRINTALGTAPTTFNYNTYSSGNQMNILIKQT